MESRDLVSVTRRVSRPIFVSLGLKTLNIAKKWNKKISIIQQFLFVVFVGKKQPKQVGKVPEI